jgi:hypothetical protein
VYCLLHYQLLRPPGTDRGGRFDSRAFDSRAIVFREIQPAPCLCGKKVVGFALWRHAEVGAGSPARRLFGKFFKMKKFPLDRGATQVYSLLHT